MFIVSCNLRVCQPGASASHACIQQAEQEVEYYLPVLRPFLPAVGALSLAQAGCMCVCRSQAWDAKIITSAWWVHPDQVQPLL